MRNQLKIETLEEEQVVEPVAEETEQTAPRGNKVTNAVSSFLSGRFLISEATLKYLPFVLFLALLSLCYIANGYYAESNDRQLDKLNSELGELRTRYVIAKSKLMYLSKESQVAQAAAAMGLKEALVPPNKIVVTTNTTLKH